MSGKGYSILLVAQMCVLLVAEGLGEEGRNERHTGSGRDRALPTGWM